MRKNSVFAGVGVLILGGLTCKALGALFRLPLTHLLGFDGIGVFSLVMSLFSFALVLTSGGVTSALSKLISSARARGEQDAVRVYFTRALCVTLVLSALLGVAFALLSGTISSLQGQESQKAYFLFPILLPLGGILAVYRGAFQGMGRMTPTASSQVVEQVCKFALGLLFAWMFVGGGTEFGVFGAFLGIAISEAISALFLVIFYALKHEKSDKISDMQTIRFSRREFDRTNFTLMLSALLLPLSSALDSLFIVSRLTIAGLTETQATTLFGLQSGVVGTILNIPLVISLSVSTAMLPNLSYAISQGKLFPSTIGNALKVLLYLILPTTFGLVALSKPLLSLLYPSLSASLISIAQNLMLYGGFSVILTALMQFFVMLLQAHGEFRLLLISTAIGGALKVAITFFLAALPAVNIFALTIGNILMSGTICTLALWQLKKIATFSLSFFDIFQAVFATSLMFYSVKLFLLNFEFQAVISITLAVMIGVMTYFVASLPNLIKMRKSLIKKD